MPNVNFCCPLLASSNTRGIEHLPPPGVDHHVHRYSSPCGHLHGTPHVKAAAVGACLLPRHLFFHVQDGECFSQTTRRSKRHACLAQFGEMQQLTRCTPDIHGRGGWPGARESLAAWPNRGRPDDVRRRQSCFCHVLRCLWIRISRPRPCWLNEDAVGGCIWNGRPEFLHSGPGTVLAGPVLLQSLLS